MTKITVIKGDGIGPEIMDATLKILKSADCPLEFEFQNAGLSALESSNELIPSATLDSITKNKIALKGPLTTPIGKGFTSINVTLRKKFNLFSNIRPVLTLEGIDSKFSNIDIITVRENTQGMYSGQGQVTNENEAYAQSIITRDGASKIATSAYELATKLKRKKVTIVHKANILKSTSGLFLDVARDIAKKYPQIKTEEMIVDATCMNLVINPNKFDIIVTTNLFGDIISDLCAGLVGGLGMAPGANIGDDVAIFEAVHGSAPDIAGKNIANPTSLILASVHMLRHLKLDEYADKIMNSLKTTIKNKQNLTSDIGGSASTLEFADQVIKNL